MPPEAAAPFPALTAGPTLLSRLIAWRDRLVASPGFREKAARFPLSRPIARRRTRALFDLCAGFVYSQVLYACVELRLFDRLAEGPAVAAELARHLRLPLDRATRLLDAAVSLRLLARRGKAYGLGPLGAAMVENGAATEMIRHHAMLYADLADPVALLRAAPGGTKLSEYWPYAGTPEPAALRTDDIARYTTLMAESQPMVAAQVLDAYDIGRHRCLLDVGGGDGRFLVAAGARAPRLQLRLFDLPAVAALAAQRFAAAGLSGRAQAIGGDMHHGSLPEGADVISLVRIIHDHDDGPAAALLHAAHRAMPQGGTLLLAEPLAGTKGAEPIGDAYFAFYLMALGSGRPRTLQELTAMLHQAGFSRVRLAATATPLLASLIVAQA